MKKSESTKEKMDIKKLLLSKENVFLKQDEIYNLIKKDFQKKLGRRALKLLPLNLCKFINCCCLFNKFRLQF